MTEDCKIGLRTELTSKNTKFTDLKLDDDLVTVLSNDMEVSNFGDSSRDMVLYDNDDFGMADLGSFDDSGLF